MASTTKPATKFLDGRRFTLLIFLPLPVLIFAVLVVYPMVDAALFSFYDWNGFGPMTDFVGLENYGDVLSHRHFPKAVRNTVIIVVASLALQLPLAMWMSLALIEKSWGVNAIRALFFLPFMLAEIATGLIWRFVYDGDYGILPAIGDVFGAELPYVLGDKVWVMPAIVLVIVWKYFGFHMMIYIAALQSISKEVIEAAQLDGVSKWKIILHIKIPMIKSAIMISVFFAMIGALQLFDLIFPINRWRAEPFKPHHCKLSLSIWYHTHEVRLWRFSQRAPVRWLRCDHPDIQTNIVITGVNQWLELAREMNSHGGNELAS